MTDYRLTLEDMPAYLHAHVVGDRTAENAMRFLKEVAMACMASGKSAVLLEMRFTGPSLDMASIFRVVSQGSAEGSKLRKIAYVEANMDDPGRARFAETVGINRNVNVRLFEDMASARRWLEE